MLNRTLILSYHISAGVLEAAIGAIVVTSPRLIIGSNAVEASVYLATGGMFLFSLGLSSLVAAYCILQRACARRLQLLWLQSSLVHAGTAIFAAVQIATGSLGVLWILPVLGFASMSLFQGAFLLIDSPDAAAPQVRTIGHPSVSHRFH